MELGQITGRINDCDSHEMIPQHLWGEYFGEAGTQAAEELSGFFVLVQGDAASSDASVTDTAAVDAGTIWTQKGAAAPSAIDLRRRPDVLDAMGIHRQLVFPTIGLVGIGMCFGIDYSVVAVKGGSDRNSHLKTLGTSLVEAWNDYAIRSAKDFGTDRVRVVGILMVDSVDQMLTDAQRLFEAGVKAVMLPACAPPAGLSPAAAELDPVWSAFEEADVAVTLHFGTEGNVLSPAWTNAATLMPDMNTISLEFPTMGAHMLAIGPQVVENYTATMVLGGVFERHPNLRFGVIEATATWFPTLVKRMKLANKALTGRPEGKLSLTPEEYCARNIRVTPFIFEPAAELIEQNPELADVFVYSSDYPHIEGGRNSLQRFYDQVAPLGDTITEKFFVTNAEWILPD